jgi:hypothetical protein
MENEKKCGYCNEETNDKLEMIRWKGFYYYCCKKCVSAHEYQVDKKIDELKEERRNK